MANSIDLNDKSKGRPPMLSSINLSHIFVNDHQQALDFYVGKLGLEVAQDVPLGFMRWLTVRVPGEIAHEILLEIPGPPGIDEKSAGQIRELISKGASGFAAGFTTSDANKTFEIGRASCRKRV